jgi:glycosyltransferase involved in cell wall biosynthesis
MESDETRRLIEQLEAVTARLQEVEAALREHVEGAPHDGGVRGRLRAWSVPRLGELRQHAPQPLRVPSSYLRTDPPSPAPRISIVTPSFRHGAFIERTIYSVLSQGYPNLEYVVQDGGSDDGTVDVLRRYEDQLASWASEPDGGQADAINRGFARTGGELMGYLNSDDLLLPGALAHVASYMAANPEVDAVYGQRVLIDDHDREVGLWVVPPHDDDILGMADFVPQESLFWRRRAWERAGGRMDDSFHYALDWDLLLRLRDSGARIHRLPRFLGAFRIHDAQKTQAGGRKRDAEADRIRLRSQGRPMTGDEAYARTRAFLRRHIVHHTMARAAARVPRARSEVRTLPPVGYG